MHPLLEPFVFTSKRFRIQAFFKRRAYMCLEGRSGFCRCNDRRVYLSEPFVADEQLVLPTPNYECFVELLDRRQKDVDSGLRCDFLGNIRTDTTVPFESTAFVEEWDTA